MPEPSLGNSDERAWDSEGGRELYQKSTARQLYQFVKAVKYLLMENLSSPLSINLLIQTYRIMMEGSCNAEGKSITVGELRPSIVSTGFHEFLPLENVEGALRKLINQYEEKRENTHPISLAMFLFQDLISIHPFVNGNGWLCRLFLSWSLMRDGLPIPSNANVVQTAMVSRWTTGEFDRTYNVFVDFYDHIGILSGINS